MKNYCFSRIIRIIFSVTIAAQILQGCKPDSNVQSEVRKFYSLESQKVILKHMSSKLSDHELRELWTKAEIERLTEIKRFDKEKNHYNANRAETLEKCKDIAFKAKNPEICSSADVVPIGMLIGPAVKSQQDIFNNYVLGACNWVGVKKAKEIGCFPNGYTPTFVTLEELEAFKLAK